MTAVADLDLPCRTGQEDNQIAAGRTKLKIPTHFNFSSYNYVYMVLCYAVIVLFKYELKSSIFSFFSLCS